MTISGGDGWRGRPRYRWRNVLEELLTRAGAKTRYFAAPPRFRRLPPVTGNAGRCQYTGPQCLNNARIATSYPHLLKKYLDKQGIAFKSCLLNGSVEVAPRRSGRCHLRPGVYRRHAEANGLREVEVIYRSKAVLIQRDGELPAAKQQLVDTLMTRIQGVIKARESKYIMLREVEVIYRSKAVLIQRDGELPAAKQQLVDTLMTVFRA